MKERYEYYLSKGFILKDLDNLNKLYKFTQFIHIVFTKC